MEDAADKKIVDEAVQAASEADTIASDGEAAIEESQSQSPDSEGTSTFEPPKNDSSNETPYALFVRNMVFEADESHLREAFAKYGEVAHTAIARDSRGLSKG